MNNFVLKATLYHRKSLLASVDTDYRMFHLFWQNCLCRCARSTNKLFLIFFENLPILMLAALLHILCISSFYCGEIAMQTLKAFWKKKISFTKTEIFEIIDKISVFIFQFTDMCPALMQLKCKSERSYLKRSMTKSFASVRIPVD